MKKINLFLIISPLVSLLMLVLFIGYLIFYWTFSGPTRIFTIKPGEGFASINYRLYKDKIIVSSKVFHRYAKLKGQMTSLQAGDHTIPRGVNMPEILEILSQQKPNLVKVTIPEGKNLYQIGQILEENNIADYNEFVATAKDNLFLEQLDLPYPNAEGYLYPDTYFFSTGLSAKDIIKIMVEEFKKKTSAIEFNHPFLKKHEVITLASIVEKETGASFERSIISGVFLNRLKKHMRLQSDPTTIYGFYEKFKGNLRKKHLLTKTDYNTYKIGGLPIGPISNPGLNSILAVLNPKKHNYLYFVSKNDGTHDFSSNYRDHVRKVNLYQKNRMNRIGKSWRDLSVQN